MPKHQRHRVKRRVRRVNPVDQLKTGLVIALCIFTVFAVIWGILYDKGRMAGPVSSGTNLVPVDIT
jgi:hypothetical protein